MQTTTVTIEVRQEDIDNGRGGSCGFCPIALALKRILKEEYFGWVEDQNLVITPSGVTVEIYSTALPYEAREFISDFDDDIVVEPFSFPLEIPVECLKP